jgi:hypothetical protein
MKKAAYLLSILLVSSIVFVSCKKEEDQAITPDETTVGDSTAIVVDSTDLNFPPVPMDSLGNPLPPLPVDTADNSLPTFPPLPVDTADNSLPPLPPLPIDTTGLSLPPFPIDTTGLSLPSFPVDTTGDLTLVGVWELTDSEMSLCDANRASNTKEQHGFDGETLGTLCLDGFNFTTISFNYELTDNNSKYSIEGTVYDVIELTGSKFSYTGPNGKVISYTRVN